jgi:hypothetical protein
MARVVFGALALVDSVLLAYLFLSYDWLHFEIPHISESIASIVLVPLMWAILVAARLFFAAFFVIIAAGIWRELTNRREKPRWIAALTSPVLLIALAGCALVWFSTVTGILTTPPGFINDRLTMFDRLAMSMNEGNAELFGTTNYVNQSTARYLVILLGAAYLAEKYLVSSWRFRWPVPVLPLIAIGWLAWSVYDGEQRLRAYSAAQQWRAIAPQVSWIDAVSACEGLGDGWRLPRREELTRYLSTAPAEVQSWTGAAWTATSADGGGWALAVDLVPRRSGRWNKGSEPTRDESLCEYRDQPGYATDWFTALRPDVCARTTQSPYLFTPGLKLTVLQRGNTVVSQPTAAAICLNAPVSAERIPVHQRRGYNDEQEFTRAADFRAQMAQKCGLTPDRDWAACFVFAPDLPAFEETGDEQTMRAFCELARNGEGCHRYALLMDQRPGAADRASRYRDLACKRGYKPACEQP